MATILSIYPKLPQKEVVAKQQRNDIQPKFLRFTMRHAMH
jgi:hypothetical protein